LSALANNRTQRASTGRLSGLEAGIVDDSNIG
jgi:hypothetical protein